MWLYIDSQYFCDKAMPTLHKEQGNFLIKVRLPAMYKFKDAAAQTIRWQWKETDYWDEDMEILELEVFTYEGDDEPLLLFWVDY